MADREYLDDYAQSAMDNMAAQARMRDLGLKLHQNGIEDLTVTELQDLIADFGRELQRRGWTHYEERP